MKINYVLKTVFFLLVYTSLQAMEDKLPNLQAMEDKFPEYASEILDKCVDGNINELRYTNGSLPVLSMVIHKESKEPSGKLLDVLDTFINRGAKPSKKDTLGLTALHYAILCDMPLDVFDLLLKKCSPDKQDGATGDTPLHFIIHQLKDLSAYDWNKPATVLPKETSQNYTAMIKKFLNKSAQMSCGNHYGETVFHLIAQKNRLDIAQLILTPTQTEKKCIMTMMLFKKHSDKIKQLPKGVLFHILSYNLPVYHEHVVPGTAQQELIVTLSKESQNRQTAYQIALEKRSPKLAQLLNFNR